MRECGQCRLTIINDGRLCAQHRPGPNDCPICGAWCKTKANLNIHMDMHMCTYCAKHCKGLEKCTKDKT